MADTKAYRHTGTGTVIAVAADSTLEEHVTASGNYKPASLDDLATDVPALGADGGASPSERDELDGNWLVPPGIKPEAITSASFGGAIAPPHGSTPVDQPPADGDVLDAIVGEVDITKAYEVDTVEGVNGYLDDHPEQAEAVLAYEAANKNRTGIVDGRHKAAAAAE